MISNKFVPCPCYIPFSKRAFTVAAGLILILFPNFADAFDILLGTGKTGTFSHFAGRAICRIINRHTSDINCKTAPAPGDVHNLTNLRGGSLDLSLVDSRMLHDAIKKTGYFKFLDINYDNLRALFPLYDVAVTLVVRKDAEITSLDALRGKRINAGAPRSPQHLAFDTIMKAKNWTEGDFGLVEELPASQSQDTMGFCHGTIQAMLHIGVHPDPSLEQLFRLCKAALVSMDDKDIAQLIADHPAFSKIHVASDVYPSHPKGVTTFGTRGVLAVTADLDEQTVYRIIDAIYRSRKHLKRSHPALSSITMNAAWKRDGGIKLHPGAAEYFSGQGQR
jgi:TRAP transporter TAXI family solute receptor